MPNYQGQLDGLCGPYAIVNAFEHCGVGSSDEIFETACEALAKTRWPTVLWDGTTLGDLQRMLKSCRDNFDHAATIKTSYPFSRNVPATNKDYWARFNQLFIDRPNARCMILGLTRPTYHWIVAFRETSTRINFVDTDPYRLFQRKNRSMLYAGNRNANPRKWIIDRSELILFETE